MSARRAGLQEQIYLLREQVGTAKMAWEEGSFFVQSDQLFLQQGQKHLT